MKRLAKKVLLIGWDAADWKIINKLVDEGKMPAMAKFIDQGTIGNLATLEPPFSPMLWTTIATGKRPDKHGILGFVEPTPNRSGIRPVASTSRKVKAIWNILNQQGMKSHVVGWWPSHPAEPINGIMVSNNFQNTDTNKPEEWKLAKGTVHPMEYGPLFRELRVHPAEITQQHLLPFVPDAAKIDQEKDERLNHIAKNIAESSSLHSAATWILEHEDWDFMGIYLDTIDHFCHGFMNYYPPKLDNVPQNLYDLYNNVVTAAYMHHDMMLDRLLQLAGDDATVMLVSDHGFHSDHLRPKFIPSEPAGPAFQHRDHGIIAVKGPNIKKDDRIYGASLMDITPTLLTMYGLPVAKDMDGTPLLSIFDKPVELDTIASWELIDDGETGMHPKEAITDPYEAQQGIQQLVELGYIEKPDDDVQVAIDNTVRESQYNLARVLIGADRTWEAKEILEKLVEEAPEEPRFFNRLIFCYKDLNELEKASALVDKYLPLEKQQILPPKRIAELQAEMQKEGLSKEEAKEAFEKNDKKIKRSRYAKRNLVQLQIVHGEIMLRKGQHEHALTIFEELEKHLPKQASLYLQVANVYLKLQEWEKAEDKFRKILNIDENNHKALNGLAISLLNQDRLEESVEASLNAIGLIYHYPRAHYHLAEALAKMEEFEHAANAYEVALRMTPDMTVARNKLIDIYRNRLKQHEKAEAHEFYFVDRDKYLEQYKEIDIEEKDDLDSSDINVVARKSKRREAAGDPIIVVSGLPRSGTSMMMQMLDKAGVEIFTDNKRTADENNPRGYYEHEQVKNLARDNKFLDNAQGKAVKVISHLLFYLPHRHHYKVIFMDRNIREVIKSQQKMLVRDGKLKKDTYPTHLEKTFKKTLDKIKVWEEKSMNVDVLRIPHHEAINNPVKIAEDVISFLKMDVDAKKVASVVDSSLHRETH